MMKKNLSLFLFLFIFTLLSPKSVSGQETETASSALEINIIPTLILDPTQNGPTEKIVPLPTPEPAKEAEDENQDKRSWTRFKYKELIQKVANQYNLDPQIIYATIMTESEGDEYAYRYEPQIDDASLCMGQILISTARSLGFSGNIFNLNKT